MSSRVFSNADQFTHIAQHLYPLHSVIIALDELTYSMFIMNFYTNVEVFSFSKSISKAMDSSSLPSGEVV
jgi:hypothetical protein